MAAAGAALCALGSGVGCGGGRVAQCNALINVINEEQGKHKNPKEQSAADWNALAGDLTNAATRIGTVELADATLVDYRNRYQSMANDLAAAARDVAEAIKADDSEKARAADTAMKKVGEREGGLVKTINVYCQGE